MFLPKQTCVVAVDSVLEKHVLQGKRLNNPQDNPPPDPLGNRSLSIKVVTGPE